MLVIGLTGGIGSGKSTAADSFRQLGVNVIDADQVARQVVEPGQAVLSDIKAHFGAAVFSGEQLNRSALRDIVFNDPEKRQLLEQLLHPLIREKIAKQIAALNDTYCIIEIPLLFESAPNPLVQRILVVDCEEDLQIDRASQRSNLSREQIETIMAAQASREYRLQAANEIIDNNKDLKHLREQVSQLHKHYRQLAKKK